MNVARRFFGLSRTRHAKPELKSLNLASVTPMHWDFCELAFNRSITRSRNHSISHLFPVNSLFLCMPLGKTRNPCGFSHVAKKIPCYFPCFSALQEKQLGLAVENQFAETPAACGCAGCAAKLSFRTNSRLNKNRFTMACRATVATERYHTSRMVNPG
jgi:hypothetical protein